MEKTLVLRIKKIYFDQILSGEKSIEYRQNSKFFQTRLSKKIHKVILICGPRIIHAMVTKIELIDKPMHLMNLPFLPTPKIFAIHLKNAELKNIKYNEIEMPKNEFITRRKKDAKG